MVAGAAVRAATVVGGIMLLLVAAGLVKMAAGTPAFIWGGKGNVWPDPASPPVWPNTFTVQFSELLNIGPITYAKNNGTWYYDFNNLTARFDHHQGQRDNFCQGQGFSKKDPHAGCQLLFTKTGDMWVVYPGTQECCRLCGTKEGCTVLKPNWLQNSKLLETIPISGRACAGWAERGAVAAADTWYADAQGVPCRYHEVVVHINHNLTFHAASFSTEPINADVFAIPDYCKKPCPSPYVPPKK